MTELDVLVIAPFRRPTFRKAISSAYPVMEPWDSPPLILAGALEAAGLHVGYLALQNLFDAWDEASDLPRLTGLLTASPARMVIFAADHFIASRSTASIFGIRTVSRLVRQLTPACVIGVTGRLATTAGRLLLAEPDLCDFVVHGEAEAVIGHIAPAVLEGGIREAHHASLVTRESVSRDEQPAAAVAESLDKVAPPAWHLLAPSIAAWDTIPGSSRRIPFSLRTSAGCRFQCRFCAGVPNWLNYRTKSPERVALEIDDLVSATGGRAHLSFLEDEVFSRDPAHVERIAPVFRERRLVVDGVYTHSSMLSKPVAEDLATMARRVYLGLDNADDLVLRDMRKGQRFDTVLSAVQVARAAGLGVHLEWIVGSPPETVDTLITTLNAIVSLLATGTVDNVNTYVYCPHPGTEYAERAEAFDLRLIGDFEGMQESGGYPASESTALTSQQVFAAYLMSQLVIAEVSTARRLGGANPTVGASSRQELHRLFQMIAGR